MLEPTEQSVQPAALRAIADLTETAIGHGARHLPMWQVSEGGLARGILRFAEKPGSGDLDPWRLAIGTHGISSIAFEDDSSGQLVWDELSFNFRDFTAALVVIYPAAPVAASVQAVAA